MDRALSLKIVNGKQMKHLTFKPEVEWRHHGRTFFEEHLHVRRQKKLTGCDVFIDFLEKNHIQEKQPIGIETSMVYIAIPIGLAVWVGVIYFIKSLLF